MGLWVGGTDLWGGSGPSRDPWRRRRWDRPVTTTTVLVAATWRWLASGLGAGALGGTFVFPIFGTAIGGAMGLAGAVVPTLLALIVLRLSIRPGMDGDAHRRAMARIHLGLLVTAVLICAVGGGIWLDGAGGAADALSVGLGGTLVTALGLLWWNGRTLIGLGPPVSARGSGVGFVAAAAGALLAMAAFGAFTWWDGGRAGQQAAAEDLAESVVARFDTTPYRLDGPDGRDCPGGDPWILTSGMFPPRTAAELGAVAEQLTGEGWEVDQGVESGRWHDGRAWLYAERDLEAITVRQYGDDTLITVTTGCATEHLRDQRVGADGG